ncbi:hypothetical protein [Kribbella sindirgiensis]|uniref:hypothetical protein n=1 Tax=Kribbella sindirgiensis TaxID=1124744 RepID=UPI0013F49F91|nr:hypothetical protein [Kribbella sindirgiensis]
MPNYGSKDSKGKGSGKTDKGSGSKGKGDMPVLYPTTHRPGKSGGKGQGQGR